jgi:hypothetical protein
MGGVTFVPFARHINARLGIELQIVEPAENTLPSKMQKYSTSLFLISTLIDCARLGIVSIPNNTMTATFLSIESHRFAPSVRVRGLGL